MGSAWLVSTVEEAATADDALKLIGTTNLNHSAVVESSFIRSITALGTDSVSGSISLIKYQPDHLVYQSATTQPQLAVFSEIYYPAGWKAYIDGNESEIIRANYILRALVIPAGQHDIEFRFEPDSYKYGQIISIAGSLLIIALILLFMFIKWKGCRRESSCSSVQK